MQGITIYKVKNYAKWKIMPGPHYAMCHIMHTASLCNVWNYPKCKITQGVKLCKEQDYAMWKIMQNEKLTKVHRMQNSNNCERPKLWKMQNYAKYKQK